MLLTVEAGASRCLATCSSDLHDLVDCTGRIVSKCPPDTACGPSGRCAAPCESAVVNHTSVGCDYYAVDPDGVSNIPDVVFPDGSRAGSCYAVFIANTWTTPVSVQAEFNGRALDVSGSIYLAEPREGRKLRQRPPYHD